jgi:hypothetical protein
LVLPLTPASMVPNTVTPLPDDEVDAAARSLLLADPVPAQPAAKAPIAMARTAAINGFTENSRQW